LARPKVNKQSNLTVVGGQIGHNSNRNKGTSVESLTDDQLQALTRQHAQKRSRLIDAEKKAKAERMNFDKVIKSELGAKGLADIKLLEQLSTPEGEAELIAEMERQARVARWSGMVIGTQGDLFGEDRRTAEEKAFEAGKRAGLSGENCQPPSGYSADASGQWVSGWHEGQAVLASGFMKKESDAELLRPESEDDGQADPFDAAAESDFGDDSYQAGDEVDVGGDDEDFDPSVFQREDA